MDVQKKSGAIVIDSTEEKNAKLREKWSKINNVSSKLTTLSTSGFIISLLSPFDFEGPVAEIVTAVVAAVGFVMKKVSEHKLDKLGVSKGEFLDTEDKDALLTVTGNIGNAISKKR